MNHIRDYLNKRSWRVKENANFNYSYSGLLAHVANNQLARYALSTMPKEISKAHTRGDIHVHNLEGGMVCGYCHGASLIKLLQLGVKAATIQSKPAKHFDSVVDQIVNYFFMSQLEWNGAQSMSDFDTLLSPFIYYDKLSYDQVKQNIQRLIFNLNFSSRQAFQQPFTNLTFNIHPPKHLADTQVIIGGESKKEVYSDFIEESMMINKAFSEILIERDALGNPFTFPIPTLNITRRIKWDEEVLDDIFKEISILGSYYFMNYIGSGINEDTVRSMCCRLNISLDKLPTTIGGRFFNVEGTGSLGVLSLNMSRLGYLCKTEDQFFERLDMLLEIAKKQLLFKKKNIQKSYKKGLLPFAKYYGLNLDNYFSTVGTIGLNEMCINFLDKPLHKSIDFVKKVLEYIKRWVEYTSKETGQLFNLEETPGEGSGYRLALIDRKKYKKIFTLGTRRRPYYSTLLIPPKYDVSLIKRIKIEEQLLPIFTGGTVFRLFIGENSPNYLSLKNLAYKMVTKTRIPYFDMTTTFSICEKEGKHFAGIVRSCPNCNSNTLVYSRVVGYYRPSQRFNPGKLQEFKERKYINDLNID